MPIHVTPMISDPRQLSLWVGMVDLAARYDTAERDMLGAVPLEMILAMIEAGDTLSESRRQSMIAAGALILRLLDEDSRKRSDSTARMLARLGLPTCTGIVGELR